MEFRPRMLRPWLLCATFGFCGWLIGVSTAGNSSKQALAAEVKSIRSHANEPFIVVDANDNITAHVENQPSAWVVEQQWESRSANKISGAARPVKIAEASTDMPQSNEEVLDKIQYGNESERYENLAQARAVKAPLPEAMLKTIYETDQSQEIRALAFTYAMDEFKGDSVALRGILEKARYSADSGIAEDAEQRLAILARLEKAQFDQLWATPTDNASDGASNEAGG